MGFGSKHDFAPPTILLGLLLYPCMWGTFSGGNQHSPGDDCSAAICNFRVLTGEDEHMSFYSTIFQVRLTHMVSAVLLSECISHIGTLSQDF